MSILITAFNRANYVGAAIESALQSSFKDFEVIVSDDASTDGTLRIAERYSDIDSRVIINRNSTNIGDYPNRNRAAEFARGVYIKYLDSDDVIYPHGLEVMVRAMEAFSSAGLGLSATPDPSGPFPIRLTPADAYRDHFFGSSLLGRAPGSAIIRRAAFEAVGGFSGIRQVGDHELWLKLSARFDVVKLPAALVWDRQHRSQEKHYDDLVTKTLMHHQVELAALNSGDCPLSPSERELAKQSRRKDHARLFWRLLANRGRQTEAYRLRKELKLDFAGLSQTLLERLRRRVPAADSSM